MEEGSFPKEGWFVVPLFIAMALVAYKIWTIIAVAGLYFWWAV
jgi:hypothetical protein